MKIDNIYLYGTNDVPEIPAEVVMRRLELLKENLSVLLENTWDKRDNQHVNAILKAINYWENIK